MHWDGVHDLIQRAKQGEECAWTELVCLSQPFLLQQAQKHLGPGWPETSVSDLVQQTWLNAWKHLASFRGGDGDANSGALLRAWLQTILRNVWRTGLRHPRPPRTGADEAADEPARDPSPSTNLRQDERRSRLRRVLDRLSDLDRELVRLAFEEGLSAAEIGRRLGKDESTIRYHLERIRRTLGADEEVLG